MLTGEEDIKNSLDVLFATNVGERIMHANYGTALQTFLFMPINKSTLTYMQAIISDEILFNEPRIVLNNIEIESSVEENGRLDIIIDYKVTATNNRYNYVYPFYLKEANNLER
jgi:phage baseplate assembly protein W